jgi:hypothetical protein
MASRSFSDLPPPSYEEAIAANILIGVNPPQPATDHAYVNVCDNRISGDVSNILCQIQMITKVLLNPRMKNPSFRY